MMRAAGFLAACLLATPVAAAPERIASIGGSVTEILFALGAGDRIVARDTTSSFPPEAQSLPDIGYMRALSPEGVMSVDAGLIVAEEGAGPPEAIAALKQAGIPYVEIAEQYDADGVVEKIDAVAKAVGMETDAATLREQVAGDLDEAKRLAATVATPRRVLFVLSMSGGGVMAGGTGTGADGIIRLAGAENAMADINGYKRVTDEAIMQAAPDVILMMDRGPDTPPDLSGDPLLVPALAATPAAASGDIVRMDGLYLLGFGPRTGKAAIDLHHAIYGDG